MPFPPTRTHFYFDNFDSFEPEWRAPATQSDYNRLVNQIEKDLEARQAVGCFRADNIRQAAKELLECIGIRHPNFYKK